LSGGKRKNIREECMLMRFKNKKGFALLEIIGALVVAGVMITVTSTAYDNIIGKSSTKARAICAARDRERDQVGSISKFAEAANPRITTSSVIAQWPVLNNTLPQVLVRSSVSPSLWDHIVNFIKTVWAAL
jgi:hypothetical protein